MFPKEKRLKSEEFDRFFGIGKRYYSDNFMLLYIPFPTFKVAAVAGKKVSKKAVVRNKVRRRMYEALKQAFSDKMSGVFILIAKKGVETLDFSDLSTEIKSLVSGVNN